MFELQVGFDSYYIWLLLFDRIFIFNSFYKRLEIGVNWGRGDEIILPTHIRSSSPRI